MPKYGEWEIEHWQGGHPVWCFIRYQGKEIGHIRHTDLQDLKYGIERLMKAARDALPDNYKHEMD
jgi:hypothetical protein